MLFSKPNAAATALDLCLSVVNVSEDCNFNAILFVSNSFSPSIPRSCIHFVVVFPCLSFKFFGSHSSSRLHGFRDFGHGNDGWGLNVSVALAKDRLDRQAANSPRAPRRRCSHIVEALPKTRRALSFDSQGSLCPLQDFVVDAWSPLGRHPAVVVAPLRRRRNLVLALVKVGRLWGLRRIQERFGERGVEILAETRASHGAARLVLEIGLAHGGHLEVEIWFAESHWMIV